MQLVSNLLTITAHQLVNNIILGFLISETKAYPRGEPKYHAYQMGKRFLFDRCYSSWVSKQCAVYA
jgi:hypothetical protein